MKIIPKLSPNTLICFTVYGDAVVCLANKGSYETEYSQVTDQPGEIRKIIPKLSPIPSSVSLFMVMQ